MLIISLGVGSHVGPSVEVLRVLVQKNHSSRCTQLLDEQLLGMQQLQRRVAGAEKAHSHASQACVVPSVTQRRRVVRAACANAGRAMRPSRSLGVHVSAVASPEKISQVRLAAPAVDHGRHHKLC